ncbi:hypothetical protein EJB05_45140, partial [Eragrostis curvula]
MAQGLGNGGSIPRKMISSRHHPLHNCSWCSMAFKSPQALGGHMRTHRN